MTAVRSYAEGKKVKASHTRYRSLGPEMIPIYIQSARRWLKSSTRRYAAITFR